MLFIESLPETTNGEDVVDDVMQYFNDIKDIPTTNVISIAWNGVAAMTGPVEDFVSGMKSVALHIFYAQCIILRQRLVAENNGGDMS